MKNSIQDNEIVKWEKSQIIDYRIKILESLILGIILIGGFMILVGLFFWYVPSWGGTSYFLWTDIEISPLFIYITIMSIFSSGAIIAVAYAGIFIKRSLRRMNLKLSDLKSYHQIHILTNIRWMQKDFRSLLHFNQNEIPTEIIAPTNDIVFINLSDIEKATVSKMRTNYNIAFQFKNTLNGIQYPSFTVKFKYNDYQVVKKLLLDLIPIEIIRH